MRYPYMGGKSIGHLFRISVATIAFASVLTAARADGVSSAPAATSGVAAHASKSAWPPAVHAKIEENPGQLNPAKRYFIEFRSRAAASYGHMYVLYGEVNDRDQIIKSAIAGLHPAGDAENCNNCSLFYWTVGHVVFVPSETGPSDGDLEEKYVTSRYRVMLDKDQYDRVSAYIKKLQAENPLWNAVWRNCVSFGKDIADYIGLRTPLLSWMEPKDFVDAMREMNGGHPQQPLADANAPVPEPHPASAKAAPTRKKARARTPAVARSARTADVASEPRR